MLAEVTAREIGRVTIAGALELTALVAWKQRDKETVALKNCGNEPGAGTVSMKRRAAPV